MYPNVQPNVQLPASVMLCVFYGKEKSCLFYFHRLLTPHKLERWLPVHALALCHLLITATNRILRVIGVRIAFHRWGWNATLGNVLCLIYECSSFIFLIYFTNTNPRLLTQKMSPKGNAISFTFIFFLLLFYISKQIKIAMYFTWQHLFLMVHPAGPKKHLIRKSIASHYKREHINKKKTL